MRLVKVAEPRRVRSTTEAPSVKAVAFRHLRMDFGDRFRRRLHQFRDAPRLRSRLIVSEHAAGREIQGKLFIGHFCRTVVLDGVKARASADGVGNVS